MWSRREPISVLRVVGVVLIIASIVLSEADELLAHKHGATEDSTPRSTTEWSTSLPCLYRFQENNGDLQIVMG